LPAGNSDGTYKTRVEITDLAVSKHFKLFKAMSGVRKIVSLGGWAFSTEPGTYSILRKAAQPANRDKFKNILIAFMNARNLDSIHLDWEYSGVSRTSILSCAHANLCP
jgi:GH18 family chitinase